MSLNARKAPSAGKAIDPVAVGTYPARLVQVIDLGVQKQKPWKGKEKPDIHKMRVTYELVDEFMKDEDGQDDVTKPRWISETLPLHNLSADRATSTQRYFALDPTEEHEGDWPKLLNTPCMVTISIWEKDGKRGNNIATISSMRNRDAEKCPELVGEPRVFLIDDADVDMFRKLPEWTQKEITEGVEFPGSKLERALKDRVGDQDKDADAEVEGDDENTEEGKW